MKRKYLLAVLIAAAMPLTSMAQDDDLYFNPKKEAKEKAERRALLQRQYAEQRARRDSVYRLGGGTVRLMNTIEAAESSAIMRM